MISSQIRDWTQMNLSPNLKSLLDKNGGIPSPDLLEEVDEAIDIIANKLWVLTTQTTPTDDTREIYDIEFYALNECDSHLLVVKNMIETYIAKNASAAPSAAPAAPPAYSWANAPAAAAASSAAPAAPIFRFPNIRQRDEDAADEARTAQKKPRVAEVVAQDDGIDHTVYAYIPIEFTSAQRRALEDCVTPHIRDCAQQGDQQGAIQRFTNPIGYHISLGTFTVNGSQKAASVAKKIQAVVSGIFSPFSAKLSNRHSDNGNGISDLPGQKGRNFVTLTLQTDQKNANPSPTVLIDLARSVQRAATEAGAKEVEILAGGKKVTFQPHCTVASYQPSKVKKTRNEGVISAYKSTLAASLPGLFPIQVNPSNIGASVS